MWFFFHFWRTSVLFVGSLIPLFDVKCLGSTKCFIIKEHSTFNNCLFSGLESIYQMNVYTYLSPNQPVGRMLCWTILDPLMVKLKESGCSSMEQKWTVTQQTLQSHIHLEIGGLLWEESTQTKTITTEVLRLMSWAILMLLLQILMFS